ncbi:MAG: xylulokinase [Candidatus Bipolaricaulota bacterium]|nr:xylulokinase [Candidatus Bipolaricaulota bacterium]MDW8126165.1 xylulokinase [Candidatus Bipolaricaulota bacterium]
MTAELLIGLDIGTTGAKGLLVSLDGRIVGRSFAEYPLYTPRPGWCEQMPDDWWGAAVKVLRELAINASGEIAAIGLTGQMHGAVFLDGKLEVIRPAILWNDARTGRECAEIEHIVGKEYLRKITGNPALAGFQAPKILWLRKHEPENYKRVGAVVLPKDYVRLKLTGDLATDVSDASGTLLLDLAKRDWSNEILTALDIPREWLPQTYESPEVTGKISKEAERLTGIPCGTPVVAGAGDNAASAVGAGVVKDGTGLVSLGSSGVVFVHLDEPRPDPAGAIHCFCHAVPGKYHLMGVILSAGASLRWFRDVLGSEEKEVGSRTGLDPYELFTREAEFAPPGADGLFFLPYLSGERTPHMDPAARGAWIGLSLAHRRPHLVRALLEGVAFALKDAFVRIQRLGPDPRELRAVGGGMRSSLWRTVIASVLEVPLRRLAVEEGAAYGAALLAGVGAKLYNDVYEAVDKAVKLHAECTLPDPRLVQIYQKIYPLYARLYPSLKATGVFT